MLWFLFIGIVAGWLAGLISRGGGFGIWGDLITGVVGSFIGGYAFKFMGIAVYGTIGSIISSTVGAIILLWAIRMFFHTAPAAHKKEE
ncbi:GlsB/YeaQ/YmgE family stress response membrane protein [Pelorhabdus rhamnosifermentans]|uniref:GlsB/YeaQ/YmgE family stress response membrane protein n=1 Tax=Pelorhabdus rhamnosifermentans TaxID=2772457 RepID=UPI001C05F3D4|nr:GlsB/YeaQ/YmgE family stress response membrane protein [Pelorhabdus rhamnosifermentans]